MVRLRKTSLHKRVTGLTGEHAVRATTQWQDRDMTKKKKRQQRSKL